MALEATDLPTAIDPTLITNNTYLIFKPFGKKKLEYSLYTSDGTTYDRHDPVASGESTRVPPGLITPGNLGENKVIGVSRYLKMFGLALKYKHVVPTPEETPQKPFAVEVTNFDREVYDRLILARSCGPQGSKPLFWDRPNAEQREPFNANIGFVEWAMLPYNQTDDIKTLLKVWRGAGSLELIPSITAKPWDRNLAFVFNIEESRLADTYNFADVDLVTTIGPEAGRSKRRRKDGGPAAPPAPGGPAAQNEGVSFVDRLPAAAPAAEPTQPDEGDQMDQQSFDELVRGVLNGEYDD